MKVKGVLTVLALAAATAAFWPAAGSAGTFKGIVVAKQRGTLLVASPGGIVRSVAGRASLGSRVVVAGRGAAVVGHTSKATIRGIVVRRIGTTLILSSNRHLVAIHNRVGRRLADTTPAPTTTTTPAPGAVVTTQVSIANGSLEEDDEHEVGQSGSNSIQVQAVVKSVAAGSVVLDIQGQTLTVPLPAGLTLPASMVGQTVTLSLNLNGQNGDTNDDGDNNDDNGDNSNGGGGGGDD